MEAARTAAGRGHEVILFEKEPRLGGTLNKAAAPSFKSDLKAYLDWAVHMTTSHPRIRVRMATAATPEMIKAERADTLVIAIGARPNIPEISGINMDHVVWVGDLDFGRARIGENIIVAGGGMTGCETALQLALQGKSDGCGDAHPEEIVTSAPIINMLSLLSLLKNTGSGC